MDQFKHFLWLNISEFKEECISKIKKVILFTFRTSIVIPKLSKVAFFSPFLDTDIIKTGFSRPKKKTQMRFLDMLYLNDVPNFVISEIMAKNAALFVK